MSGNTPYSARTHPPRERSRRSVDHLVGGVPTLLGFLVLPLSLFVGYSARVARSVADGGDESPVFNRWSGPLGDGAKEVAITAVTVLVTTVVLTSVFGVAAALAVGPGSTVAIVSALLAVRVWVGA